MTDDQQLSEETLADLCADLLSDRRNEPFLIRLFAEPAAQWHELAALVRGLDLAGQLSALDRAVSSATRVAWLDYPDSEHGAGYATVMFLNEALFGRIWIYNRSRLLRSSAGESGATGL